MPFIPSEQLMAAEDQAKEAATVESASKVLDLRTLALPMGAVVESVRQVGSVNYEIKADPKKAFQLQQQQFLKLGWKELPGSMAEPTYGSGMFSKSNFVVTVSTSDSGQPDKPGTSRVSIINFGNIRPGKLPVIKGAKSQFTNEATAMYLVDGKVADTTTAMRQLLVGAGWEPYGAISNPPDNESLTFKRHAQQVHVFISKAPAAGGKTSIMLSCLQLSADIPAPTNGKDVNYVDMQKTLRFQSPDKFPEIGKFYQQSLGKLGWKATTEKLIESTDTFKRPIASMIFRNPAKELINLELEERDGPSMVKVTHLTADEFAQLEKQAAEAAKKRQAEKEALAAKTPPKTSPMPTDDSPDIEALAKQAIADALNNKPGKTAKGAKDKVSIPVPEKARKVTQKSDNVLQITVPAGTGSAGAELIRDQLTGGGWTLDEDDNDLDENSGHLTFKKGKQQITLTFVDTGLSDPTIMLIAFGAKLEAGKAGATDKDSDKKPTPLPGDTPEPASKKPAGKKSKPKGDESAIEEPARKDKPKQGIGKLAELPNQATVTIDDSPVKLNHIIAYEVISHGEWRTKILATEKAIKQEALLALLKKKGNDEEFEFPQPHLRLELDDEDKPSSLGLYANQTPGSASSSSLTGEALVEDGRARGTVKLKEPGSFFKKTYMAEISFDVPVLTRDSTPAKRLTNAKKLANSGKLTMGTTTYQLPNVVAYEVKVFDEKRTAIFVSEKPIDMNKLKASLKNDGTDDGLFEFQPQVRLQIDSADSIKQMNLWADNASVSSNADLAGDVVIEDGRARGTVKLSKPGEFAGKTYTFDVTFDVAVLPLPD